MSTVVEISQQSLSSVGMIIEEYDRRKQSNPRYSRIAFARDLGMSTSYLSMVLNGQRVLSEEAAIKISGPLKLSQKRERLFLSLNRFHRTCDPFQKQAILDEINRLQLTDEPMYDLNLDSFRVISSWYHYPIVELTTVADFRDDPEWIGQRLGIDAATAHGAITRLLRLGLLTRESGRLEKSHSTYQFVGDSDLAFRQFQAEVIRKSAIALDNQTKDERHFSSATFAFDVDDLPEVKEMIREFRGKLLQKCGQSKNKKAVYQFNTLFFRLDRTGYEH